MLLREPYHLLVQSGARRLLPLRPEIYSFETISNLHQGRVRRSVSIAGCPHRALITFMLCLEKYMTSDERAQLIEDIRRSNVKRERIIEQASADESFDLAAAWQTLDELDNSINERVVKARVDK